MKGILYSQANPKLFCSAHFILYGAAHGARGARQSVAQIRARVDAGHVGRPIGRAQGLAEAQRPTERTNE